MAYGKWKPSRAKAREYVEKLDEVQAFCDEHAIRYSGTMDSYYFSINGQQYRVSNHTVAASNSKAYRLDEMTGEMVKVREKYHNPEDDVICITAGKTRLIEVYNNILTGKKLDKRGKIKDE